MPAGNRSQSGLTRVALLKVCALFGSLTVLIFGLFGSARGGSSRHAKTELLAYAKTVGWDVQEISCAAVDSDGDGYIPCTAAILDGHRKVEKRVECASGAPISRSTGCKVAILKTYGQDR